MFNIFKYRQQHEELKKKNATIVNDKYELKKELEKVNIELTSVKDLFKAFKDVKANNSLKYGGLFIDWINKHHIYNVDDADDVKRVLDEWSSQKKESEKQSQRAYNAEYKLRDVEQKLIDAKEEIKKLLDEVDKLLNVRVSIKEQKKKLEAPVVEDIKKKPKKPTKKPAKKPTKE